METDALGKLAEKAITKQELLEAIEGDFELLPTVIEGVSSSKASVRYGCAKVLMDLSARHPRELYPHMDFFVSLLDSKHRILVWNAMAIVANLCKVDTARKFDALFDKYYRFLGDEYMVTVANVVGNSGKIALAKPYLIPRIVTELLRVDRISTSPHLTEECKRVIAEKTIESCSLFFEKMNAEDKAKVVAFVKEHANSRRATLKIKAERFLKRWAV